MIDSHLKEAVPKAHSKFRASLPVSLELAEGEESGPFETRVEEKVNADWRADWRPEDSEEFYNSDATSKFWGLGGGHLQFKLGLGPAVRAWAAGSGSLKEGMEACRWQQEGGPGKGVILLVRV